MIRSPKPLRLREDQKAEPLRGDADYTDWAVKDMAESERRGLRRLLWFVIPIYAGLGYIMWRLWP